MYAHVLNNQLRRHNILAFDRPAVAARHVPPSATTTRTQVNQRQARATNTARPTARPRESSPMPAPVTYAEVTNPIPRVTTVAVPYAGLTVNLPPITNDSPTNGTMNPTAACFQPQIPSQEHGIPRGAKGDFPNRTTPSQTSSSDNSKDATQSHTLADQAQILLREPCEQPTIELPEMIPDTLTARTSNHE